MKLPEFLFADSPDIPGAGLMIATQRPCYIIKVFKFTLPEQFDRFMNSNKFVEQIPGYMMAVQYYATIGEGEGRVDPDDVQVCLIQAADYYLQQRVNEKKSYYKRHLI